MHVLALDFDGVISDSAPEAFVVALRTFAALSPGTALATEAAALRATARHHSTRCAAQTFLPTSWS